MKLIESKTEYIPQATVPSGSPAGILEGIYKQIELAGRCCYRSEDKITESSAKGFVDRMIKSGHGAMLEHGTVYLMVHTIAPEDWDRKIGKHRLLTIDDCRDGLRTNPTYNKNEEENWWAKEAGHKAQVMAVKYADNLYSKVKIVLTKHELNTKDGIILTPTGGMPVIERGAGKIVSVFNTILITTNYRTLIENNWLDDLQYLCLPTEHHEKRYTFKFTTDRGISHELVRHRTFSFAQESQRYCNYSNDKYGNELTFILPSWLINILKTGHYELCTHDNEDGEITGPDYTENVYSYTAENIFVKECLRSELQYLNLVNDLKYSPQQARAILPNATKTELIMTGFASDWRHVMDLRLFGKTGAPHPDMLNLMQKAQKTMQEAGIWDDIMSKPSKFDQYV